eukprot:1451617-Pyramimonas_sp.AAC.1
MLKTPTDLGADDPHHYHRTRAATCAALRAGQHTMPKTEVKRTTTTRTACTTQSTTMRRATHTCTDSQTTTYYYYLVLSAQ